MIVQCKNCLPLEGIEIPEFTQSDKRRLSELKLETPIKAVQCLVADYKLSPRDAKYIATHINRQHSQCNRCNFDKLDEEYIKCPKCKALNFNWKIK